MVLISNPVAGGDPGEGLIFLNYKIFSVLSGTWQNVLSGDFVNFIEGGVFYTNSGDQNAEITTKVYLAAGTYTFILGYCSTPDNGIVTLYIAGSSKGTIDTYSAGTVYNLTANIAAINIAVSGLYDLNLKMATKNGASSAYDLKIQYSFLKRTA
jgi:hypothetical protein